MQRDPPAAGGESPGEEPPVGYGDRPALHVRGRRRQLDRLAALLRGPHQEQAVPHLQRDGTAVVAGPGESVDPVSEEGRVGLGQRDGRLPRAAGDDAVEVRKPGVPRLRRPQRPVADGEDDERDLRAVRRSRHPHLSRLQLRAAEGVRGRQKDGFLPREGEPPGDEQVVGVRGFDPPGVRIQADTAQGVAGGLRVRHVDGVPEGRGEAGARVVELVDRRHVECRPPVAIGFLQRAAGGPRHALLVPVRHDRRPAVGLGEGDVAAAGGAGVG
ncbi:hypothetical protein LzC2_40400 [Planctomycetes bacterium LzC2]|uniref:Uncharacterized protein n=1 Tax=Alienimonas chondri TaxID=2681879 RepID=A0ABX1VIJ1_9PLAN|nr:hypothetical protein [Alienimonas chondri]